MNKTTTEDCDWNCDWNCMSDWNWNSDCNFDLDRIAYANLNYKILNYKTIPIYKFEIEIVMVLNDWD
jgi:hypothetical protein